MKKRLGALTAAMIDKAIPPKDSAACAKMKAFFLTVQRAKSEIGASLPAEGLRGFPEAWAGLTVLENGVREAYAKLKESGS